MKRSLFHRNGRSPVLSARTNSGEFSGLKPVSPEKWGRRCFTVGGLTIVLAN